MKFGINVCEKGPYSFSKFSTLTNHISSGFWAITFRLNQTIVLCKGYIRTKFQSFKVKLRILNYVLFGLAIRLVFTEPITNKEHIHKKKVNSGTEFGINLISIQCVIWWIIIEVPFGSWRARRISVRVIEQKQSRCESRGPSTLIEKSQQGRKMCKKNAGKRIGIQTRNLQT